MPILLLQKWILRIIILISISLSPSCSERGINNNSGQKNEHTLLIKSHFDLCETTKGSNEASKDTILVKTVEELKNQIRSNRVLKLIGNKYSFKSTLKIDSVKNLKLIGTGYSELVIIDKNASVINILNSQNIHLDNLTIGHSKNQEHIGKPGIVNIEHASNINISNCKILSSGTFGLVTNDVCKLKFTKSEITECTALLFELERSRKFEFINSKFHNNNLGISVLGGFTNSTKEITFTNCEFINNTPKSMGNPAFNFEANWTDFEEKIIFSYCTFKNNKGYKWYGDKIKLDNCKIDSSDFIGLQRKN